MEKNSFQLEHLRMTSKEKTMKKMLSVWVPSILLFAACDNRQPYYDSEGSVSVAGVSVESGWCV